VSVSEERSAGDFDAWYRSEWPRLVASVVLACGDRELGRDIAAEAFARALERWASVSVMSSPEGWTYVVAINLLRRRRRRSNSERRALARAAGGTVEGTGADDSVELWELVASLPDRERVAVALRYGGGLTEPEIAAVLGVATGTVSATLNHARAKLRTALRIVDEEVTHG
jgi:RNA polymerase sigma-70 factor (ECF subfamily)